MLDRFPSVHTVIFLHWACCISTVIHDGQHLRYSQHLL